MKRIAIYPGSFDPITKGHIDVIERSAELFDEVFVVVAVNVKKNTLFSKDERKDMVVQSLKHLNNISVHRYDGLIVDFAKKIGAKAIIRGIRAISDFDFEIQLSQINRSLAPDIYTLFMAPHKDFVFLNSTIVRELARHGSDISEYVSEYVESKIIEKFNQS